jgi:hypothetical protein
VIQTFDLFGDPVREYHPKGGRPVHVTTQENRNKTSMLLAFGWNNKRIARALHISLPTLRARYFAELKYREEARDSCAWVAARFGTGSHGGSWQFSFQYPLSE